MNRSRQFHRRVSILGLLAAIAVAMLPFAASASNNVSLKKVKPGAKIAKPVANVGQNDGGCED